MKTNALGVLICLVLKLVACQGKGKLESSPINQSAKGFTDNSDKLSIKGKDNLAYNNKGLSGYDEAQSVVDSIVANRPDPSIAVVIELDVLDTVPISYVKQVKRIFRKHHREIVVKYPDPGKGVLVRLPPLSDEVPDIT